MDNIDIFITCFVTFTMAFGAMLVIFCPPIDVEKMSAVPETNDEEVVEENSVQEEENEVVESNSVEEEENEVIEEEKPRPKRNYLLEKKRRVANYIPPTPYNTNGNMRAVRNRLNRCAINVNELTNSELYVHMSSMTRFSIKHLRENYTPQEIRAALPIMGAYKTSCVGQYYLGPQTNVPRKANRGVLGMTN